MRDQGREGRTDGGEDERHRGKAGWREGSREGREGGREGSRGGWREGGRGDTRLSAASVPGVAMHISMPVVV